MSKINFATFNINCGVPYKNTLEFKNQSFDPSTSISRLINQNDLDIACFQEILVEDEKHFSMSKRISKKCDLKYYKDLTLSDSHIVKDRKMGVSILSKYPITKMERFFLDDPNILQKDQYGLVVKSHKKGFLITKLQLDTVEICCVTGHCIPFHSFEIDVMDYQYIYKKLEEKLIMLLQENYYIIVGADFNTTRLEALMPKVFQQYRSLVNTATRPNGRRDDYIFCDKNSEVFDFRLIKTCYDHYGCMITYGVNK